MVKQLFLYSDFNCPFCFALERRLDGLPADCRRNLTVQWRGVEHAPGLPIPMALAEGAASSALLQESSMVQSMMPDLGLVPPGGKPNTGPAILAVASAAADDPEKAGELRHLLFSAFWQGGRDLSDPGLLAELSKKAGLEEPKPGAEDEERVLKWRREWEGAGVLAVPLLVDGDGGSMPGLVDEGPLLKFILS